jgi:hypothetical protein
VKAAAQENSPELGRAEFKKIASFFVRGIDADHDSGATDDANYYHRPPELRQTGELCQLGRQGKNSTRDAERKNDPDDVPHERLLCTPA